tara:strand:+ start:2370 stop:2657 length:288 start_codon:yes stop_codon:yes gene_type:complete
MIYDIFINKSIKLNSDLLEIELDNFQKKSVENFIFNLNNITKFIIFAGSVSLVLLYFALFLIPKQAQFKILSFLPMINKIFNFYRKLILIAYYEN